MVKIETLAEQVNTRLSIAAKLPSQEHRAEMLLDVLDLLVMKYQVVCDLGKCCYQRREDPVKTEEAFVFLLNNAFRYKPMQRMLKPVWCPDYGALWLGLAPSDCKQHDVSFLLEDARDFLLRMGNKPKQQQSEGLLITHAARKREYYYNSARCSLYLDTRKRIVVPHNPP